MHTLVDAFKTEHAIDVDIVSASSGKLYAQIKHGAPFDVFFSADQDKIERLENNQLTIKRSRFTYAIGRLVLWSNETLDESSLKKRLFSGEFERITFANPKVAPYGKAAQEFLKRVGLELNNDQVVLAENINQAYLYALSNNVELGLVALSQVIEAHSTSEYWEIPVDNYSTIKQDAVLLKSSNHKYAEHFLSFVKSTTGQNILQHFGYEQHENRE